MSQPQPFIKPENIDNLPYLDADKKQFYKNGLSKLWAQYLQSAQGTPAHQEAETKIKGASAKLMQELAHGRNGRPGSGGGQQPHQAPPRPPQQPQPQQQQQPQQQRPSTQGTQQGGVAQQGNASQQGQGQPGGAGVGNQQLTTFVRQQLHNIQIHMPPNLPPANAPSYKQRWYQAAVRELARKESAMEAGRRLQAQVQGLQKGGHTVPPNIAQQYQQVREQVQDADQRWNRMKSDNEARGRQAAQQVVPQGQPGGGPQPPQMQRPGGADAAQNLRTSLSPPVAASGAAPQSGIPFQNTQQSMGQPSASQQTPQTATQPQPPQGFPQQPPQPPQQQAQPPQQPQQQQQQQPPPPPHPGQQRPQINTQVSHGQFPQQHQQTPQSAMPSSAAQPQQPQQQRPQALSQQAAVAQATAQYAQSQQQQQQQQQQQHPPPSQHYPNQPQFPNGMPFNQQSTPVSGFHQPAASSLQTTTNANASTRFPINKTIKMDPRIQQPVQGPPSRPTLSNAGMIQQPGLARPAAFTLEGEGDRVLSKRKLDELVRQVTGGGEDGFLSPEVEEQVLQYADDFVDSVITSACKLAKCKPNPTLELRDVQMALERNYGIRIPGYALDEVRTVKKFQPAPGWQSKMQAIQTAKTLGGVGKGDS